jgi:hypothetical protein
VRAVGAAKKNRRVPAVRDARLDQQPAMTACSVNSDEAEGRPKFRLFSKQKILVFFKISVIFLKITSQ